MLQEINILKISALSYFLIVTPQKFMYQDMKIKMMPFI